MNYEVEEFPDGKGRVRHGSPTFYKLLEKMADVHDRKSHDYASDENPFGNYEFSGEVAALFAHSPKDAGFAGRMAEKLYRIANLERAGKTPKNESIEDTEDDLCVIVALWMSARKDRRRNGLANAFDAVKQDLKRGMDRISQSQDTLSCMISLEALLVPDDKKQFLSYLKNCIRDEDSTSSESSRIGSSPLNPTRRT